MDEEHSGNQPTRRRPLVWLSVLAALGAAVTVLGMTGGLAATPNSPQQAKAGAPVNQGRFTVTVLGARIGMVKTLFSSSAKRSLIVRLRVANNGTDSASIDPDLREGIAGEPTRGTYKAVPDGNITGYTADGAKTTSVEPGLPITTEISWELSPTSSPARIIIALRQWEYHPGFTDVQYNWWMTSTSPVMAEISVPVQTS